MTVTLAGWGGPEGRTEAALAAVRAADGLLGSPRMLEDLPPDCTAPRDSATVPEKLLSLLQQHAWQRPCVLYGGDPGFHAGAGSLIPLLDQAGIPWRILPGISTVQLLSARLGRPWQDWILASAHGQTCDVLETVCKGRPALFLTDPVRTPAALCRELAAAGLGDLSVTVGERLSWPGERLLSCTAAEAAEGTFHPLSVLLTEAPPRPCPRRSPGFPDGDFFRGDVPMTKQEVRAVILSKLAVRPGDTVWDIGAGTGSVSIELSFMAGRVFAVERTPTALELIRQNRRRFGAWNVSVIPGAAPAALKSLPAPDAVFIGGSGGALDGIVEAVLQNNPAVRLCLAAVTAETLSQALSLLERRGIPAEITQIAVTRTRKAGAYHLFTASNPVFLLHTEGNP